MRLARAEKISISLIIAVGVLIILFGYVSLDLLKQDFKQIDLDKCEITNVDSSNIVFGDPIFDSNISGPYYSNKSTYVENPMSGICDYCG